MAWVDPPKSWQFSWSVVSVLCHRTYRSLNNTPGFPLHPRPLLCPALTGSNETPTGGAGEQYGAEQEQSNKPGHKDLEKEVRQTFREKPIVRNGWYFQILINVSWLILWLGNNCPRRYVGWWCIVHHSTKRPWSKLEVGIFWWLEESTFPSKAWTMASGHTW